MAVFLSHSARRDGQFEAEVQLRKKNQMKQGSLEFTKAFLCRQTKDRLRNTFSNALSGAISKHISLSATWRETLTLLIMRRQGTICPWRLAAHVAAAADSAAVLPVFPTRGVGQLHDGGVAAGLLGMRGQP